MIYSAIGLIRNNKPMNVNLLLKVRIYPLEFDHIVDNTNFRILNQLFKLQFSDYGLIS